MVVSLSVLLGGIIMVYQRANKLGNSGFSLVELMIAMLLGLVVLGLVGSVYTSGVKNTTNSMKKMTLYQSLNDAMSLMSLEIGRAGHLQAGGDTAKLVGATHAVNIFSPTDIAADGQCVEYVYERKVESGAPVEPQNGAFFLSKSASNVNSLYWSKNTLSGVATKTLCDASNIPPLTDPQLIEITQFELTKNTVSASDAESHFISVTISGRLINDYAVNTTITRDIKVRNWD